MRSVGGLAGAAVVGLVLIAAVAGAGAGGLLTPFGTGRPGARALADIPARYLSLYANAATTCPGLDWPVLAAVGKVETDHGRSPLPGVRSGANSAGARGPMQFLLPTFTNVVARHPALRRGPRDPSPYDPDDAIPAAAAYLCDSGARNGANITRALWTYNHDNAYVAQVLAQADEYRHHATNSAATRAIDYAQAQLGLPYLWGGNGPEHGDSRLRLLGPDPRLVRGSGLPASAHGPATVRCRSSPARTGTPATGRPGLLRHRPRSHLTRGPLHRSRPDDPRTGTQQANQDRPVPLPRRQLCGSGSAHHAGGPAAPTVAGWCVGHQTRNPPRCWARCR